MKIIVMISKNVRFKKSAPPCRLKRMFEKGDDPNNSTQQYRFSPAIFCTRPED
ncbi:MAG: hypothetical protein ABEJ65_12640 [bacterium]